MTDIEIGKTIEELKRVQLEKIQPEHARDKAAIQVGIELLQKQEEWRRRLGQDPEIVLEKKVVQNVIVKKGLVLYKIICPECKKLVAKKLFFKPENYREVCPHCQQNLKAKTAEEIHNDEEKIRYYESLSTIRFQQESRRNKPQKIVFYGRGYACPSCGAKINKFESNYCHCCGQRIEN